MALTAARLNAGVRLVVTVVVVEVLLYVHRNRRLIGDGEPRTSTSTFTEPLSSGDSVAGIRQAYIISLSSPQLHSPVPDKKVMFPADVKHYER